MKQHILVLEDSNQRRTIILEGQQYSIGRHSSTNIQLQSRQASRHHATLVRKTNSKTGEDAFWIIDGDLEGTKSQNGVFVNGDKKLIHELKNGDLINFGCGINASYHITGGAFDTQSPLLDFSSQSSIGYEPADNDTPAVLVVPNVGNNNSLKGHSNDETFHEQSYLDTITNLPNQTLFLEYLNIAISNAKRYKTQVGLLLYRIENWTEAKRKRGDTAVNILAKESAENLKNSLRQGDIISRWNDDQFMVLLTQIKDGDNLTGVAQRLVLKINSPIRLDNVPFLPLITYATAIYPDNGLTSKQLIDKLHNTLQTLPNPTTSQEKNTTQLQEISLAEMKMQMSPATVDANIDRSPESIETPSHLETAVDIRFETPADNDGQLSEDELRRLAIVEKRIKRALVHHELELYYQPQINCETSQIEAFEAFIRWQHPSKGLLAPSKFLPWSDRTEILLPLTYWILNKSCSQSYLWQAQLSSSIIVSVNISEKQFFHPQFVDLVKTSLEVSELEPECLELEISESLLDSNQPRIKKVITPLHQMGVRFSLDDFGSESISLRHLIDIPFYKIKIDKALIKKLVNEPENRNNISMLKSIISVGKSFGFKVTAEGVEHREQRDFLYSLGCKTMQGYYFCEPLNVLGINSYLKKYLSYQY